MAFGAGKSLELSASATSLNATDRLGTVGVWSTSFLPAASLIQNLPRSVPMPSTAPSCSLRLSPFAASQTENLIDDDPLFRTSTGNDDMCTPFLIKTDAHDFSLQSFRRDQRGSRRLPRSCG